MTAYLNQPGSPAGALRRSRSGRRDYQRGAGALALSALLLGLPACTQVPQDRQSSAASASGSGSAPGSSAPGSGSASVQQSEAPTAESGASSAAGPSDVATAVATSTAGAVAPGFPAGTLPVFEGAQVKQSAFERGSRDARASLVLQTDEPAEQVMDFYSRTFTSAGFKQLPGDAVGSVRSRTFIRSDGAENANVSAVTEGDATMVTVAVTVAPGALK